MPIPADARFWLARALGLWRRGWASLRTRGLRASWARLRAQFARRPAPTTVLWRPEPTSFAPFALATSGQPRASVVIPVHGAFPHTLACLRALAAHPPAVPFEVIVRRGNSEPRVFRGTAHESEARAPKAVTVLDQ